MYDIQKLQENGSKAAGLIGRCLVAPMRESVAETQPLLLNKDTESLQGAIVGV